MLDRLRARLPRALPTLGTLVAAVAGGAVFALLALPAPWLSGGIVVVVALAIAGAPVALPTPLAQAAFVVLGLQMGAGVTPQTLGLVATWPITMAAVILSVPAVTVASGVYLARLAGFDRLTAFFAAVPGALSYVMALSVTAGADVPRVAFVQTVRLFLLAVGLPVGLAIAGELGTALPAPKPGPLLEVLAMLAASAVAGFAFLRWKVPGGIVVGAMLMSALLHGSGLVTAAVPNGLLLPCYVLLAAMIGVRFVGTTVAMLRQWGAVALVAFLISGVVAAAFAAVAALLVDLPFGQIVIALAPGGFEAMVVLGFALGFDPAFIAAHHLVRFVGIALVLPFVVRALQPPPPSGR